MSVRALDLMNFIGFMFYWIVYASYLYYIDRSNIGLDNFKKALIILPAVLSPIWLLLAYRLINWIAVDPMDEATISLIVPASFVAFYFHTLIVLLRKEVSKDAL